MNKIIEIKYNSDLNNLKVGDKFKFDTSADYSQYDVSNYSSYKNKVFHYIGNWGRTTTFNYISKDYLIFHDTYLLLTFYNPCALPF